jgi:acyl-coenzyme A synthetase/AMP-(fatty) acid ligase
MNLSALLLDQHSPAREEGPAVRSAALEWSAGELARRVGATAAAFADAGVRRGDTVAITMADRPQWLSVMLGAARIGAVCALASPLTAPERLADAVARAAPAVVVSDGPGTPPGTRLLDPGTIEAAVDAGLPDPGPVDSRPDDPCYLLLTSGSTGPPKWAVHRHGDIRACIETYGAHVIRLRPGDVTWSVAALGTSYGFGNSCYFPLAAGATAWVDGMDRSPEALVDAVRAGGVNVVFGVPTWWARLARHASEGRIPADALGGVRLAVSAGEHLPSRVWHEVRRALGLELVNGLGSSEATNLYLSDRPGSARAGTVGWPVPGFSLRIVPHDGSPPGEGELLVRGASVMAGYLGDPAATARALEDGWLHTGDLVRREPDGSHTFLGRIGEAVKVGGLWVTPSRVQAELLRHPDVTHAIVLGVEDGDGLTRLGAAVTLRSGAPDDLGERLPAACAGRLAAHEIPRAIVAVDELPALASGKPDRAAIGRLVAAALATPATPTTEIRR